MASYISDRMIERAGVSATQCRDRIEFSVIDATHAERLMELGSQRFDAAICTMALMDMSSIEPLSVSLSRLLKAGGRFVFSLTHP